MAKKIIFALILGLTFLSATANNAFALFGIEDMYMTDAAGKYEARDPSVFTSTETPWLFLDLTKSVAKVTGVWGFGDILNMTDALSFNTANLDTNNWEMVTSGNDIWLRRLDWSSVVKEGVWSLAALSWNKWGLPNGIDATSYTVTATPEPISSALFLLGGSALGLGFYRRRKK